MTPGDRPWRRYLDAIRAAVAAEPELDALGLTLASAWSANLAVPAIIVTPLRRYVVRPADVRWELVLQVVIPLQSDDDEPLHALQETALAALPADMIPGETTYGQDDRAGASYVVASTAITA